MPSSGEKEPVHPPAENNEKHEDTFDDDRQGLLSGEVTSHTSLLEDPNHQRPAVNNGNDQEVQSEDAATKYKRLGWKRLTVVMVVEAIALGTLSIPSAFATLGMIPGIFFSIGFGLVAIYTSYVVGQVKLKFPHVVTYSDAGYEAFGKWGKWLIDTMFILQLIFIVGSHTLTGTIALDTITQTGTSAIVWTIVSALVLLLLAVPPSFSEVAILGYVDFVSLIVAVGITIISTGVRAGQQDGGLAAVSWSAWPQPNTSFANAFNALANIIFAYSFAMCQFSFMDEMHTPKDFPKAVFTLGALEIGLYTITGALVYVFVGQGVQSPALLSGGKAVARIAFGVALPVIFISGSINTVVLGRLIHGRIFRNSPIRYVDSPRGWGTWLGVISLITLVAWMITQVIPFFEELLSLSSALFISGFSYYFPGIFWFRFLKSDGKWTPRKITFAVLNGALIALGGTILVAGSYSTVASIVSVSSFLPFVFSFTSCHR